MTDFEAIDALLAGAREEVPLPPVEVRRGLREGLGLSRAQVAQALGVSPSTVGGWETGRDPGGEVREKYAYFLEGARTKLEARAEELVAGADEAMESPAGDDAVGDEETQAEADGTDLDDVEPLSAARPCVLCGGPALHQVAGFPQHLDPAECGGTSEAAEPVDAVEPVEAATPSEPEPEPESEPKRAPKPVQVRPVGRRMQAASDTPDLIGAAVTAALAKHEGDLEAATAALVKRAIPDAMALLDETRKGGRYDVVAHPWIPDVLRKQSARGADHIWEARPKWARQELPSGAHEVTALDINGAYLSASRPTSRSASWSTPPASTTTAAGPAST